MENRTVLYCSATVMAINLVFSTVLASSVSQGHHDDAWLYQTLTAREAALTRAYDTCNLHALRASLFAGTTVTTPDGRHIDPVIDARDHVCGRLHREVVPGSLVVRALGDDSALVSGVQRFCANDSDSCSEKGERFFQLWTLGHGHWRMGVILDLDATR
ncbi:MAG: nuclear transport factor 2 family protein [Xanthomonadaceae bacterium]|nr:nuclear transport factor 2 family protein [Xanthomonadaceae bacterium]